MSTMHPDNNRCHHLLCVTYGCILTAPERVPAAQPFFSLRSVSLQTSYTYISAQSFYVLVHGIQKIVGGDDNRDGEPIQGSFN